MLLLALILWFPGLLALLCLFAVQGVERDDGQDSEEGFVMILGGAINMGSDHGEKNEQPVHEVKITAYMMGKYELTWRDWQKVMGPCAEAGADDLPVENLSWYAVLAYCNRRSLLEDRKPCYSIKGETDPELWGAIPKDDDPIWNAVVCDWDADGYRLPTEAEWEFAARGGASGNGFDFAGSQYLDQVGWYADNSGLRTRGVGGKEPNELGLHDMSGNVWEWCWDWFSDDYYGRSPDFYPTGPDTGTERVARGGSWESAGDCCRVSYRGSACPGNVYVNCRGVRLARNRPVPYILFPPVQDDRRPDPNVK